MGALLFLDTTIHDTAKYERYKQLAKPIVDKYQGVYRVRGGDLDVRQSELWQPSRIVIIEFPSIELANTFIDSDEYAEVKPIRESSAECTTFIVASD